MFSSDGRCFGFGWPCSVRMAVFGSDGRSAGPDRDMGYGVVADGAHGPQRRGRRICARALVMTGVRAPGRVLVQLLATGSAISRSTARPAALFGAAFDLTDLRKTGSTTAR